MKHFTDPSFWDKYKRLSPEIQKLASQNFELLKSDPKHPSLHFKTVDNGKFHSVRIGLYFRALGLPVPDGVHWFWVGTHGEYDHLVG